MLLGSSGSAAIPKVIITDIGMSRIGSSVQETSRWMAIELIIGQKADFTKASDVWAFGMTAYVSSYRSLPRQCPSHSLLGRSYAPEGCRIISSIPVVR